MKRILFGRLKSIQNGEYSYYIPPIHPLGDLHDLHITESVADAKRLLFLQSRNGIITFGVRKQLDLKDEYGRRRCNFMGYQLEGHETSEAIPFFNALHEKFDAIQQEAHDCHHRLDKNGNCGRKLQDMQIQFGPGNYQADNAWDEAVSAIRKNPSADYLMMFDEDGKSMQETLNSILNDRSKKSVTGFVQAVQQESVRECPSQRLAEHIAKTEKEAIGKGGKFAIAGSAVALLGLMGYWVFSTKREKESPAKNSSVTAK